MRSLAAFLALLAFSNPSIHADEAGVSEPRFERHQFSVSRHRGRIYFDGQQAVSPVSDGSQLVDLIETFDQLNFENDHDFLRWARRLRSTRTYTYDDVIRKDEAGNVTTTPLVLLPANERAAVNDQWNQWLAQRNAIEDTQPAESDTGHHVAHSTATAQSLEIARSLAGTLASLASAQRPGYEFWEVELYVSGSQNTASPASLISTNAALHYNGVTYSGSYAGVVYPSPARPSRYVRVTGENSEQARRLALARNPGFEVGSIRKIR